MNTGDQLIGPRRALLMWALVTGVASTSFPTTLLSASLDLIRADFDSTLATISWVQVAPSLAFGLGMPLAGKMGDLYGHRRVYLGGLWVALVSALLTILAWDPLSLIVIRTLGQLGGAAAGPTGMAIIAAAVPEGERAKSIGLLNIVGGLSPVVAVLVGGPVIDQIGWRSLFALQLVPAAAALVLALVVVPETPRRPNVRFDIAGGATLAVAAMVLLLGINRARPLGVTHPLVIALIALGPALLAAFVYIERTVREPMLPLVYLRQRAFSASVTAMTFAQASFIGGFVISPLMVQRLFGYSVTVTSLLLISRPAAFSLGSWLAGRNQHRDSVEHLQRWGHGVLIAGSAVMVAGAFYESLLLIELALITTGFGNGYSRTTLFTIVSVAVDQRDVGVATGVANMVSQIGGAAGTTILSAIVAESVSPGSFGWAFVVATAISVFTWPAAGAIRRSTLAG